MTMGHNYQAKSLPLPTQQGPSQDEGKETSGYSKLSRYGATTGALLLAAVLGGRTFQVVTADRIEADWGTVDNPRIGLAPNIKFYEISTFRSEAASWIEMLQAERTSLLEIRSIVDDLIKEGTSPGRSDRAKQIYEDKFGPLNPPELDPEANYAPEANVSGPGDRKDERERARELIEALTGTKIPSSVSIKLADVGLDGVQGFANSFNSTITVDPCQIFPDPYANYLETVGCIGHEYGHFVFQYGEKLFASWTPWDGARYETSVREEAVAVLFRTLMGAQIEDPAERFLVSGDLSSLIGKHLRGEKDYGIAEGAALADAALTLYPNPYEAYAAITTHGPLDPALREVIKVNGELARQAAELERFNEAEANQLKIMLRALIN